MPNRTPAVNEAGVGSGVRVALATAPSLEVGERLIRALVDERIIACGNIVPGVVSIYRWQGTVQRDAEVLLVLKTTAAAVPRLLERIFDLHPFDVPETLVLTVEKGIESYLEWVVEEVVVVGGVGP